MSTTTGGDPSTGDPPPTTGPTSGTSGTSETSATSATTGPQPECQSDADCGWYCGYCDNGECWEAPGCCGLLPGPGGDLELRCIGYECYDDAECDEGEFCDDEFGFGGFCSDLAPIPVCERLPLSQSEVQLQSAPSALKLADLDGDGALDLVAALSDGMVEIALGDGQGGFAPGTMFPTGLTGPGPAVAVADFNLDGSPDLAVTAQAPVGELSLLFGQDAVFAAPVLDTIGEIPQRVWAGDFDGDGVADLVSHDGGAVGRVTLRSGDGTGGFGAEEVLFDVNAFQFAAGVGQVVGGEALEIVAMKSAGPGATVVTYMPGEGFVPQATLEGHGTTKHDAVAVGDVDGDGTADVVGHRAPDGVPLIQVWPMLMQRPELALDGPVELGPIADVDGDGLGDVVTVWAGSPALRVIFLDAPCVQTYWLGSDTTPSLVASGDLDGDGKADIVAGLGAGSVNVLRSGP